MNHPRSAAMVLVLLYGLLAALVAGSYSLLPERVATHFGANGEPNGWMSRQANAAFTLLGAALTASLTAGIFYVIRVFPPSMVNLPNRDYWLAPERREETYDTFFAFGLWTANVSLALFLGIEIQLIFANRSHPAFLPPTWAFGLLAAFVAAVIVLCVSFIRGFWRVDDDSM